LLHNTVRIETQRKDGKEQIGTGFFFTFTIRRDLKKEEIPVVITCWHVISGAVKGRVFFSEGSTNALVRGKTDLTAEFSNFESAWTRHPDTNVDLAIMPLAETISALQSQGKILDFVPIDERLIPSENDLAQLGALKEVKFVGYPIGIWDAKNNLPIARKGMTATDPGLDYNGRSEFLIDAAVFPGFGGSPVYTIEEGAGLSNADEFFGTRIRLLGIMFAMQQQTPSGGIETVMIPTAIDSKAKTQTASTTCVAVKSSRLNEFKTMLENMYKRHQPHGKEKPAEASKH